jgi:hypothetical protein
MKIIRIISIGIVSIVAVALDIGSLSTAIADNPACTPPCIMKNGVLIIIKTGKPATPDQIRTMGTSQPAGSPKADTPKTGAPVSPSPSGGGGDHSGGGK